MRRRWVAVAAVVTALTAAGCGLSGGTHKAADPYTAPDASGSPSPVAERVLGVAPPQPTPTTPAARPTTGAPKVKPTKRPGAVQGPPPPAAHSTTPPSPGCKPTYSGPVTDKATVAAALDTAAAHAFWFKSAPSITVPRNLMRAFAWQESGWQDTILACDGGIGTMQIMPGTAEYVNANLGANLDVHTLSGNTKLGAAYIELLVKWLGDLYFQSVYDLTNQALLDSVVAAYNVGPGAVNPTKGTAGIPNWQYVHNVEALVTSCPCQST